MDPASGARQRPQTRVWPSGFEEGPEIDIDYHRGQISTLDTPIWAEMGILAHRQLIFSVYKLYK